LIFEGHHEYVTQHEYDAVTSFRDRGGNLIFLSANNFFWKITISGNVMTRVAKWRDLGRPEAALIGVEYYHNDMGEHRGPWVVRSTAKKLPWLLGGTGLRVGMKFSSGGIEADEVTTDSPKNVRVIAAIPNLYGDGRNAEMTYYDTPAGAKVFAAGAFSIAGAVWQGHVRQLVTNLWDWLSKD
ncbi:MAG TPA: N,N-dimethylformamidase beta subunit family domain-containing protein, partial [Gaiellaceae bacterium]|nr:N,N-dimethylformamidase beta subunit family domain-containing protein [Gaiellaceae bacterium]